MEPKKSKSATSPADLKNASNSKTAFEKADLSPENQSQPADFTKNGNPEESVTKRKFKNLQRAVDEFLFLNPGHKWIQYDILSIILHKNKEADFFLLEDVFL
jgi:hypothetical protein